MTPVRELAPWSRSNPTYLRFALLGVLLAGAGSLAAAAAPEARPEAKGTAAAASKTTSRSTGAKGAARSGARAGRLVLVVSIDQLRWGDLLSLAPAFGAKGFAGLGKPMQLRYDTAVTETAADHATLSTGAYADLHGIVANRWMEGGRVREAVDDPRCAIWERPDDGRSAAMLRVPTIGDSLKLATLGRSRVVSVANKDRTALFLGGTSADLALFWDAGGGRFTSTTCYGKEPPAWLLELRKRHPISEWVAYTWTPSRPAEQLARYADPEAPGVVPGFKIGERFPHKVGQAEVSVRLYDALRSTPAATTLALQAAKAAVEGMALGEQGETDLLFLGISSIDGVGHQFGSHSLERADALLRLHDELGAFIAGLRARLGNRLAVMLTADHGLGAIPAQARKLRVPGGVIAHDDVVALVERALGGTKEAPAIAFFDSPYLSLKHGEGEGSRAAHLAAEALRGEPGLWRVVETAHAEGEPDFVRHSIYPGRSGDLLLVPRPGWMSLKPDDGADHGSPWNDDALVPVLWQTPGYSLRPVYKGGILQATQIAPSLAVLLGVPPPGAALAEPALQSDEQSPR